MKAREVKAEAEDLLETVPDETGVDTVSRMRKVRFIVSPLRAHLTAT